MSTKRPQGSTINIPLDDEAKPKRRYLWKELSMEQVDTGYLSGIELNGGMSALVNARATEYGT